MIKKIYFWNIRNKKIKKNKCKSDMYFNQDVIKKYKNLKIKTIKKYIFGI